MSERGKKTMTRLAVASTVCGAALLIFMLGALILRYWTVETELDRMLTESLTVHTAEASEGAGYLIHYAETVLNNAHLLIREYPRRPENGWVRPLVNGFDLVDDRMDLSYLDEDGISSALWAKKDPELLRRVLAGESVVSQLLPASMGGEDYVAVLHPVDWDGAVVGVLAAKMNVGTLLRQGTNSSFFHSVDSVIAGEDGSVVFGGVSSSKGANLVDMCVKNGITAQETAALTAAYQKAETVSYYYDTPEGRFYVAWGQVGYHGWRVVQFSQTPSVQIERSSKLQTMILLGSLVVCAGLAALAWRLRNGLAAEKLRYNALAQFKDTLLFEYDCASDSLEFTTNALDTLALEGTCLEQVTAEGHIHSVFHLDDVENIRHVLRSASSLLPEQIEHDRIRLKKRDGEYSWYRSQYKAMFSSDGRVTRVIGTLTDINAQIDREQELRQQAQQDALTGLYNRAGVKLINARLEQMPRGVLFMLDLDDFKAVNDNYGHATGDKLLCAVARTLEETFRSDDIVARVGGDEFVAFLAGSDNEHVARQKAQELLDRVKNIQIEGFTSHVSVSIGAACAPANGRTYEALSVVADEALYIVKNAGKGGFALRR